MHNLKNCQRCNKETNTFTGSYFNTEMICTECDEIERLHPLYEEAKRVEFEEVCRGNYNYEGIGLPENYNEFAETIKSKM